MTHRDMNARIDIEPGQVWKSDSLGMILRIKHVSERLSSRRQGCLRVEYISPEYANGGDNRMTKAWLRRHYRLATLSKDDTLDKLRGES